MTTLEFYGAAGEVTGSCHVLTVNGRRILLDCGMIQGGRAQEARNAQRFPFSARKVDAAILSHAHVDHCGRMPLLVKRGFRGPIHAQNATRDLASILMRDSAGLLASQARRASRKSGEQVAPIFTKEHAARATKRLVGHEYRKWFDVAPGVRARFHDAGHIMGSAVVEVAVATAGGERTIVFSGDLGQFDSPILNDPESLATADVVLMESTYGNRTHKNRARSVAELEGVLNDAAQRGGHIIVPAFAVGRSQELIYHLGKHYREWGVDRFRIFLDSPLAIEASHIYWDYPHLYDEEATRLRRGVNEMPPLPNLLFTRTADESKRIRSVRGSAIIIAGSGMCNGGRVLHHLKNHLTDARTQVLFTSYQAPGTLGRRIIEGAESVRIHGREVPVDADVHTIGGLSAHGDRDDLVRWYRGFGNRPPVYLVHGDPDAAQALAFTLGAEAGARATVAQPGLALDLATMTELG